MRRPESAEREGRRTASRSALLGLPSGEQLAPVIGFDVDVEALGRGLDALPRLVAVAVADPFDLVEAGHGVAHVGGVGERLLACLGERELAGGQIVLLGGAQALGAAWHPLAFGAGALGRSGLGEVSSRGLLLLFGRHGVLLLVILLVLVVDSLVPTRFQLAITRVQPWDLRCLRSSC